MIDINLNIAERLRQMADLLEQQDASPFRVNAYRQGADTIAGLSQNIGDLVQQQGIDGLIQLPTIGKGIAMAVYEMVATGRWSQLERLRGTLDSTKLFQTLPGIGPKLAQQIHDQLQIDSLEGLEVAAHDGRLETVTGIGQRRLAAVRAALAERLRRHHAYRPRPHDSDPTVEQLLAIDSEYRENAAAGQLPTITPKRFNPKAEAWLPILHTQQSRWHFSALYSNTALAHKLDRCHDWVVIYFYEDDHQEGQCTVVTETKGALLGHRVVRGREDKCRQYYGCEKVQSKDNTLSVPA